MPNWAEGTLKVRGTQKEIATFLRGAFGGISAFFAKQEEVEIEENDYSMTVKSKHGLHVNGTRRAFIDGEVGFYFDYEDDEIVVLVIDGFKQAWAVESAPFAELSKKFNVDIKIHAFEKGMEFNQEIEIHKGEIIKDEAIEFTNYRWDCVMPNLGG